MRDPVSKEWWVVLGSDGTNGADGPTRIYKTKNEWGMCLKTRGQPRGLILKHLGFFNQGLPLAWSSLSSQAWLAGWLASLRDLPVSSVLALGAEVHHCAQVYLFVYFSHGFWGLKSCPHACTENTLSTEVSLQVQGFKNKNSSVCFLGFCVSLRHDIEGLVPVFMTILNTPNTT